VRIRMLLTYLCGAQQAAAEAEARRKAEDEARAARAATAQRAAAATRVGGHCTASALTASAYIHAHACKLFQSNCAAADSANRMPTICLHLSPHHGLKHLC